MTIFCKHEWKTISETVTKSKYEIALEASKGAGIESIKLPWQLCDADRKHIQVFACEKCGKFKRFVEAI